MFLNKMIVIAFKGLIIMKRMFFAVLCASVFLAACNPTPVSINSDDLNKKLNESHQKSAVSWWYLGEKDSFHYIVEKYPFQASYYKIEKTNSPFKFSYKKLTFDEEVWINIKAKDKVK